MRKVKKNGGGEKKKKKSARPERNDTGYIVTGCQAAVIFGVQPRTIRNWHTELGMPRSGPDQYDLRIAVPWRMGQERKETENRMPEIARYKRALADAKETQVGLLDRKLRQLDGALIEREEVEGEWLGRIYAVKTALSYLDLILGRRLAGVEETEEIETVVAEEVELTLLSFAGGTETAAAGRELTRRLAGRIAPRVTRGKRIETVRKIIEQLLGDDPWGEGD